MKTRPANNAVVLLHPQDILNRHLRQALKPFAAALRQAAALDLQLAGEMTALHPDLAKKEANILLEAAANGDKKAEATLREAGGTEAYIKNKCGLFDLARAKFEGAAKASAPLWTKVSAAVIAAYEAAEREIREQLQRTSEQIGEPTPTTSWEIPIGHYKYGISRAAYAAENMRHGAAWQIEALGLSEAIAE
jgi:hypothetical protein